MQLFFNSLMEEFRRDRLVYVLGLSYVLAVNALLLPAGYFYPGLYMQYLLSLVVLDMVAFPALTLVFLCLKSVLACPRHPARWLWHCFTAQRLARIVAGYGLMLAIVPFMATFTSMKAYIGQGGFVADRSLADIDRWLHFGVDPAVFLHGALDYASVWRFFAFFYGPGWMLWVNGFVFWMAVGASSPVLRQRFFLGYLFAWAVLGNLVAWLVISAGPAFYAEVTGDAERFGMVVRSIAANVLPNGSGIRDMQTYLWDLYVKRDSGFGMGISAFPSLHLAAVTLCAVTARHLDRVLFVTAIAVVLIIEVGSVLFAWHYAIDGYFSIVVMIAASELLRKVGAQRPPVEALSAEGAVSMES